MAGQFGFSYAWLSAIVLAVGQGSSPLVSMVIPGLILLFPYQHLTLAGNHDTSFHNPLNRSAHNDQLGQQTYTGHLQLS